MMRGQWKAAGWAVLAAICWISAEGAAAPAEKELLEGAIREGSLLWYAIPVPFNDVVAHEFRKKYPQVKLEVLKGGGTQLIQKFELEQEKGAVGADLISSGLTEAFPDLRSKGYLADLKELPHWKERPAWAKDPIGSYFYYANFKVGLAYNTSLVKDSQAPDSYAELADPKWKEKLALFDTTAGFSIPLFRFLIEKRGLGWDWVARLKQNQPLLMVNAAQVDEAVTSGRRALAIVRDTEALSAQRKGAPVGFKTPKEGFMLHLMPVAINRRAAHPKAARLFVSWLLSDEAQKRLSKEGYGVSLLGDDRALKDAGGWFLDPEKIDPEETKRFVERLNNALHGS